jgi:hypothetical protein
MIPNRGNVQAKYTLLTNEAVSECYSETQRSAAESFFMDVLLRMSKPNRQRQLLCFQHSQQLLNGHSNNAFATNIDQYMVFSSLWIGRLAYNCPFGSS